MLPFFESVAKVQTFLKFTSTIENFFQTFFAYYAYLTKKQEDI